MYPCGEFLRNKLRGKEKEKLRLTALIVGSTSDCVRQKTIGHHGLGDRCDLVDGGLDLDTRVWVWVARVTLLGVLLGGLEWRVRLSLLLEPARGVASAQDFFLLIHKL